MHTSLCISLLLFFCSTYAQNYITDYHQPSILGHKEILKGDYYKAIEYLEICTEQKKVLPPDLYSLGICYFLSERIEEGANKIYESYRKGHSLRALIQDSVILINYFSEGEYNSFMDSCSTLLRRHDSLKKIKFKQEEDVISKLFIHYWKSNPYFDSVKKSMDSITYINELPNIKIARDKKLQNKAENVFEKLGWETINTLVKPRSFIYLVMKFPDEDLEELQIVLFEEVKKGNVSPWIYIRLYDLIQKKYGSSVKYSSILLQNLDPTIKDLVKNDCFQIGIGSREVLYLKYREYRY